MSTQNWAEVRRIFEAVVDLDASHRQKFLDEACAGRQGLRDEVASLLRAHDTPETALDSTPELEPTPGEELSRLEGKVIGRYRLDRALGRGGMGVVYRAVRDDGEVQLTVAVKLLPPDAATELSALAERLAELAPSHRIDWSDSWSDEDLNEFRAASLRRLDAEESEDQD